MCKRPVSAIAVAIAVVLASTACAGKPDPGNPEAFCELLRDGVGLSTGGTGGLDELETAAPPDIRLVVRQVTNSVRSLDEIPDADLGELFEAAFDSDAVDARTTLRRYAVTECGSAPTTLDEPLVEAASEGNAEAQLLAYIETNFGTTAWFSLLSVEPIFEFGRLESLHAEFSVKPASPDDSLAACNALAVYLFELQGGSGEVAVRLNDALLAGRSGPTAQCVRP